MASVFLNLEGDTVKNGIWNFLIIHSEFDYSMKDIADNSGVSYSALKLIWKEFVERNLVVHTRNVGKAKMYELNRNNSQVEKFINYYWSVVDSAIENSKIKMPA